MSSLTLHMSQVHIKTLQDHYQPYLLKPVPYSVFRAKYRGVTITAYQSGKVLFQGTHAQLESQQWQEFDQASSPTKIQTSSQPQAKHPYTKWTMIGSDEVGNGSYFGSLTVCAVYLSPTQFDLIKELGVKDSKLLSDQQIRRIAQDLKHTVTYQLTECPPLAYNRGTQTKNANQIKVSLHNFNLLKLIKQLTPDQIQNLDGVLIDQFTPAATYYHHLKQEAHTYTHQLYFEKKAEQIHLAVACASIIARDAFLESLSHLGQAYGLTLPSGAGQQVDAIGKRLVKQYGAECLKQIAKLHFANTQKILKPSSNS